MMKKTLIAAALVLNSAPVLAADLSYNYAQLSFLTLDNRGVDADGFGLKFSGLVAPTIYLVGGYSIVETDSFGPPGNRSSVEIDTLSLGVGLRHPVDPKTEARAMYPPSVPRRTARGDWPVPPTTTTALA